MQSKPKPSQPKNPEPKLDASNGILVAFLKVALDWESYQAAGPRHPDDPPEGYRSWTWAEVVEECGWSGAWLAGARVLSRRAASHSTVTEGPSQLRARARSQTGAGMGATSRAATEAAGQEATAGKLERQGRRQVNKISKEIDEAIANAIPLVASNAIALPITNKPLTGKSAAALMEKLNEQFAVVKHGGKVAILTFERHVQKVGRVEYARLVATFLRFSDFRNLLMHKRIKIGKKLIASGEWWLEQERRRQYDGLVYKPGNTASVIGNKFNLWRGWGVEPKAGDWSLMKTHIKVVMAADNQERFEYVMNWLAWAVLPRRPPRCAEKAKLHQSPPLTADKVHSGAPRKRQGKQLTV